MTRSIQIKSEIQLLVAGNDPRNFFEAFIRHLSLANIQIQNFGGVNELRGFLRALADAPGFYEVVKSLGIVRDAEMSAERAFQSFRLHQKMPHYPCRTDPKSAWTPDQR